MLNQLLPDGDAMFFPCPSAVTSGMAVLIGKVPAVAIDDYNATSGGTTFCLRGVYALTVIAQSQQSPVSGLTLGVGDELFASGTLDATTNVTYSLTIDKTRGNVPFGMFVGTTAIASGATSTTAAVKLNQSATGAHGV
jgi:predicted RecA/RadA family phage recombinase